LILYIYIYIYLFIYLPCSRLLTCESCARASTDTDSKSGRSLTRRRVAVSAASVYKTFFFHKIYLLHALLGCLISKPLREEYAFLGDIFNWKRRPFSSSFNYVILVFLDWFYRNKISNTRFSVDKYLVTKISPDWDILALRIQTMTNDDSHMPCDASWRKTCARCGWFNYAPHALHILSVYFRE
jgi:hypothetical protein